MRPLLTRLLLVFLLTAAWGCEDQEPEAPQPGVFEAGFATVRMPVPLGIGTAGFNGIGAESSPTPFSDLYPGTTRIHGHPDIKVTALSRGAGFELILIRTDMIAVIQQLRNAVVDELEERTGRSFDQALVMGATHTHSGPGRFIEGGLFRLIADQFFPEFYAGLVSAIADGVEQALDDLAPAELGHTIIEAPEAHGDRRCEDGVDYQDDRMPLVLITRDGSVAGLVGAYAIHGTVLGIGDLTLSRDVFGAIEEQIAQGFEQGVHVQVFNSWAADMAPETPALPPLEFGSDRPDGHASMDDIGYYLAGLVHGAIPSVQTTDVPAIESLTVRYPIDTWTIGYTSAEFDYPHGGVYCSVSGETCDEVLHHDNLSHACIPFPEDSPAPTQSLFTVGRLGDLHFTTWSGECSTGLAGEVMASMEAQDGVQDLLFIGYSNDYLGYQLQEEDWWHGGYEASGSMWGPRQGEYMKGIQSQVFARFVEGSELSFSEPALSAPFDLSASVDYEVEEALDFGVVAEQPAASYPLSGVVSFAIHGSDPWLGAPTAALQHDTGTGFQDVVAQHGDSLHSDGHGYWVDLVPDPAYSDESARTSRTFRWVFSFPLTRRDLGLSAPLSGTYRFRVDVPGGAVGDRVLETNAFEVGAD